jgi:hypothetical protein
MVHGNYYGIQYEIHLTKDLDFYDDLLPIWMEVRARIEIQKDRQTGNRKLIVIPYDEIGKQIYNNTLFNSYVRENNEYGYNNANSEDKEGYLRSQKFVMVKLYENYIKRMTSLPKPITKEEFNNLVKEKQQLKHKSLWGSLSREQWKEHDEKEIELTKQLDVQMFIHDAEYFEEIKSLHAQILEQVSFTEEQSERIKKVTTNPKLEGIISWQGLKLVDGFW